VVDHELVATPRRMGMRALLRLIAALACYAIALPFEAVIVWSALQVILAGAGRVLNAATLHQVAAIALARAHPVPSVMLTLVSLAAAFAGAALHRSSRRAVSEITPP
jgi:hypothetical protein